MAGRHRFNQPPPVREPATKAIREIGTNALPYLLGELDARESRLKQRLIALLRKQTFIKLRIRTADERMRQATWAFKALGPAAAPAIPQLVLLLDKNPGYVPGALTHAGPNALPHLFRALESTNYRVRSETAAYLGNAIWDLSIPKSNARPAVPLLVRNLQDTNNLVRWHSASTLGAIAYDDSSAVSALINALGDSDANVVREAARALGQFGPAAAQAIPALRAALNHQDPRVNTTAAEALKVIE